MQLRWNLEFNEWKQLFLDFIIWQLEALQLVQDLIRELVSLKKLQKPCQNWRICHSKLRRTNSRHSLQMMLWLRWEYFRYFDVSFIEHGNAFHDIVQYVYGYSNVIPSLSLLLFIQGSWSSECCRLFNDEDCQWHQIPRFRTTLWIRRTFTSRKWTGLFDYARKSKSYSMWSRHYGMHCKNIHIYSYVYVTNNVFLFRLQPKWWEIIRLLQSAVLMVILNSTSSNRWSSQMSFGRQDLSLIRQIRSLIIASLESNRIRFVCLFALDCVFMIWCYDQCQQLSRSLFAMNRIVSRSYWMNR